MSKLFVLLWNETWYSIGFVDRPAEPHPRPGDVDVADGGVLGLR